MITEWMNAVIAWSSANFALACMMIFLISLAESLIVIGLFIPGILAMSAIGGLVSSGALPLLPTLLFAVAGAICGDSLSYSVGRRYKRNLSDMWIFRKFPHWLARSENFFCSYGSLSVIIGRFLGPMRPFIPAVAGVMSMCPRKFFVANIISAIFWAPIYILPGYGLFKLLN